MPYIIPHAPYNLDNFTNTTNLYEIANASNQVVNGLFALFILLSVFLIVFMALKRYDTKDALLASSFITTILTVLMITPLQWVSPYFLWLPILLLIGTIIVKMLGQD